MAGHLLTQRREKRKFGLRRLIVPLLLMGAVYYGYQKYLGHYLDKANAALAADRYEEALTHFRKVAGFPLSKGKGEDGLGAVNLLLGDLDAARTHFKIVLADKPRRVGADPALILDKFLAKGNYPHAQTYVDFLKNWKAEDAWNALTVQFAAVALGNHDLDEAGRLLDRVSPAQKLTDAYTLLDKRYKKYARDGVVPILLDRAGNPLLQYDLKTKDYAFINEKIFAGWTDTATGQTLVSHLSDGDRLNRVQTTIDLNLQKAAHHAMRDYEGTMVVADPKTGDILVAYGTEGYNPFTASVEPGSVIKLLTYGLYLESGGDTAPYAPKVYSGHITIGGKVFYDWTEQGKLNSVEEGMAVSCNLMFAQMGIDLSMGRWLKGARSLFDGEPKPGLLGEGTYGRILKDPEDAWELARAAIGLDHLQTTSLGLVLIPMAIGAQGDLIRPTILRRFTNVLDTTYQTAEPTSMGRLFSEHVAEALARSMEASVSDARGTARRAEVDFVKAGMKTGTSGERPFNSVMVGMLPLRNPKLAFAFFLHNGGKCEINGARVAKRLQEQIRALAPEYLE